MKYKTELCEGSIMKEVALNESNGWTTLKKESGEEQQNKQVNVLQNNQSHMEHVLEKLIHAKQVCLGKDYSGIKPQTR